MTGHQGLQVLIGIAVALLLILLLLIATLVIRRPKGKLAAAYRRFSSSDALPSRNLRRDCWFYRCSSSLTWSAWGSCCPERQLSRRESPPHRVHLHSERDPRRPVVECRSANSLRAQEWFAAGGDHSVGGCNRLGQARRNRSNPR